MTLVTHFCTVQNPKLSTLITILIPLPEPHVLSITVHRLLRPTKHEPHAVSIQDLKSHQRFHLDPNSLQYTRSIPISAGRADIWIKDPAM
jgi:hypothetical protein